MTSPVYSALPQELLLDADPRRPGINTKTLPLVKKLDNALPQGKEN